MITISAELVRIKDNAWVEVFGVDNNFLISNQKSKQKPTTKTRNEMIQLGWLDLGNKSKSLSIDNFWDSITNYVINNSIDNNVEQGLYFMSFNIITTLIGNIKIIITNTTLFR